MVAASSVFLEAGRGSTESRDSCWKVEDPRGSPEPRPAQCRAASVDSDLPPVPPQPMSSQMPPTYRLLAPCHLPASSCPCAWALELWPPRSFLSPFHPCPGRLPPVACPEFCLTWSSLGLRAMPITCGLSPCRAPLASYMAPLTAARSSCSPRSWEGPHPASLSPHTQFSAVFSSQAAPLPCIMCAVLPSSHLHVPCVPLTPIQMVLSNVSPITFLFGPRR